MNAGPQAADEQQDRAQTLQMHKPFFFFPFCGLAACGHLVAGLAFAHAREMFHTRALAYILQMQTVIQTHAFASFVTVTGGFPSSILL